MNEMSKLDHYICAALIGLRANSSFAESRDDYGAEAVRLAKAALAAAGESGNTCSVCSVLQEENARLKKLLLDLAGTENQDLIKGHVVMSTAEVEWFKEEINRLNRILKLSNRAFDIVSKELIGE